MKYIVSNKQYTDDSVLDYIKDSDSVKYPNEKIIPVYPINPYDWIDKVKLSECGQDGEIQKVEE